jgi:hypothetical protein
VLHTHPVSRVADATRSFRGGQAIEEQIDPNVSAGYDGIAPQTTRNHPA